MRLPSNAARCGFSSDLSGPVTDRALFHCDNAYFYPAVQARSAPLYTNTVSNTAFRGFGGPQGMVVGEEIVDRVARFLGLSVDRVRERNFYREGETPDRNQTHYGQPVVDKVVTVGGEVGRPVTLKVPIGTPYRLLIEAAEGPKSLDGYTIVVGGPATGKLSHDWNEPVTKTTGGVLVFPSDHPLIRKKTDQKEVDWKLAKAVCCQCNLCTQLCPRNNLGLGVEPHKAMRAAFMNNGKLLGDVNGLFSCCDCGLCSYYACNFGLSPSRMMARMKSGLRQNGYKPEKRIKGEVSKSFENTKVPTKRLISRMGILQYDVETPLVEDGVTVSKVRIPLSMHIGAPSIPVVKTGDRVQKGQLIAGIPEKSLGACIHASLSGTVTDVTNTYIEISAQ